MAIDLVLRRDWNARPPRGDYTQLDSTKGVKVHYTGGTVDQGIVSDHGGCVALVRSIQGYHMDGNGWVDIGYSYVACPHRKVFEGRGLHHLPAANGAGLNAGHYAVLGLVGNAGLVQPPDGMLHGILDAVQYVRDHGRAGKEIKGHRDGYATDCPGAPLYAWVRRGAPRPEDGGNGTPAPVAPPFPGRLLKYPPVMRGQDVRTWQAQMSRRGFELTVDGAYGAGSREVCRRFQRQQGVADDGIVGPVTWRLAWEAPLG
ncbi:peptidoglycan recognition protein family protein [Nonomuraea gerenzanensis]|uniref:N-acetylmuramoyl-L-alanine amidase (Autolysin) n=1 Tax=Nonomuraea gerenzanensis TaxID=93944 RepID=A0A1M4E7X2_9ACTN|nr:N-acetylmuramoyl-L-alanine amidase [Nonomuraea gerenzanensis]UBU17166.1 N-acetylmuramoyl-L-alanine amidase [Nonomuraea gerenzanensis]SBO94905.1 N-acetylmuramoyl-L-alanine amidase (Autolysin) [Nonomuraea gerenzanensis]